MENAAGTFELGWLCLLPPILTILLAIFTRRVVVSLLIGVSAAVWILLPSPAAQRMDWGDGFTWFRYVAHSGKEFFTEITVSQLWASLIDPDHLRVFAFTALLGMQVALIHRSGGMQGIVRWSAPLARSRGEAKS